MWHLDVLSDSEYIAGMCGCKRGQILEARQLGVTVVDLLTVGSKVELTKQRVRSTTALFHDIEKKKKR